MNLKIIYNTLFLLLMYTCNIVAQSKIGIFLHGFQSNADTWVDQSFAPQRLIQENIFDKYVTLSYETGELTPDNRLNLLNKFIDQIKNNTCIPNNDGTCIYEEPDLQNDQFVLIGHSLGGIVSRVLYPALLTHPLDPNKNVNIVGVISIAGPMQGTGAADVTTDDVRSVFGRLEDALEDAFDNRSPVIDKGIDFLSWIMGEESPTKQLDEIPDYLIAVRDFALGFVSETERLKAGEIIGRDGSIIKEINAVDENNPLLHPQKYLSVIGAEKENIPFRMAGQIFTDGDELKDEQEVLDKLDLFKDFYIVGHVLAYKRVNDFQYALYRACLWMPFGSLLCDGSEYKQAKRRVEIWKEAKRELENIDSYWGFLIDSYRIEEHDYQEYIPPCPKGNGNFPPPMLNVQLPTEITCSANPGGQWRTGTTYIKYPIKSDGIVSNLSARWSADDQLDDNENSYFDDVDEDGGYNHFELRNYERAYDLKAENGSYLFRKGDRAPQYDKIVAWLDDLFSKL